MIDWISGVFGLSGMYLLSKHNKIGWVLLCLSSICWIMIGVKTGLYGLIFISIIYLIIEVNGYLKHPKGVDYIDERDEDDED